MALKINDQIFVIVEHSHVKPGKGSAFVRIKLKNVKTHQVLEKTFKSADKLEDVPVDERTLQFMYQSGDDFFFMDQTTFEETMIPRDVLDDSIQVLQDNLEVVGFFNENEVLKVTLPNFIITEVTHTEPGLKGDSTKAGTKPATIDTGATIQVPLFIDIGEVIKVDTRTGTYVERVKK
jgi:elongation factor P